MGCLQKRKADERVIVEPSAGSSVQLALADSIPDFARPLSTIEPT